MTSVEDRLGALLHETAPHTAGVDVDAVLGQARRRRRAGAALSAAAVAAVVVAVTVGITNLSGTAHQRVTSGLPPAPATNARAAVTFNGIAFSLPDGWTVGAPRCGPPADKTVVVGTYAGSCPVVPLRTSPHTAVTLAPLYGRLFARSWPGDPTTVRGQPAWVSERRDGDTTIVTLALPWANAFVTAQSPVAATARALIQRVSVHAATSFDVPATATSVFVQSLAGHDGDGQSRDRTMTAPADVRRLLDDLRALPVVRAPGQACDGAWSPHTVLVTVSAPSGERTYAARFDRCGLVLGGTGVAARGSDRLLADIRGLVPNSGL